MSARMLPTPWILTEGSGRKVDVEDLCRGAIAEHLRNGAEPLSDADYDAVLADLLGDCAILLANYQPTGDRRVGAYLYDRIRLRPWDARRRLYGRRGQHRVLDDGRGGTGAGDDDLRDLGGGPDRLHPASGDPSDGWADALGGLYAAADRGVDGTAGVVGQRPGAGAEGVDRGAGVGAGGRARRRRPRPAGGGTEDVRDAA